MVLYYGVTHYHFLCAMLHKMKYHGKEKAVLLIPERINDSRNLKEKFEKTGIFSQIYLYGEPRVESRDLSPAGVKKEIEKMVHQVETEFPVNVQEFDEINVSDDHYAFGTYLVKKGISYNFFEDGCGRLSTEKDLMEHVKKMWPIREHIIRELKLFGNAQVVKNRYGDLNAQAAGYENPKDVHFSVTEILSKLSKEEVARIIKSFTGAEPQTIKAGGCLLLTQHFINLNLMNYAGQEAIYKTLADYFAEEGQLVIKPHPSDIQGLYREWFPDALVLERMLPAELLPYCVTGGRYKTGLSASSTSINNLSGYFEETICFSQKIEKTWGWMNKYYIALRCMEKLQITSEDQLFLLGGGLNLSQLEALKTHYKMGSWQWLSAQNMSKLREKEHQGRKIILVTNLPAKEVDSNYKKFSNMLGKMEERDVVILLPDSSKTIFASESSLNEIQHILPVAIDTYSEQSGRKERIQREYIYIYTRNKEYLQEVLKMNERKKLKYSGVEIEVNPSEQTEVKILEGINRALEDRVVELAQGYKELKRTVQEYEEFKESRAYKVTCMLRHFIRSDKK